MLMQPSTANGTGEWSGVETHNEGIVTHKDRKERWKPPVPREKVLRTVTDVTCSRGDRSKAHPSPVMLGNNDSISADRQLCTAGTTELTEVCSGPNCIGSVAISISIVVVRSITSRSSVRWRHRRTNGREGATQEGPTVRTQLFGRRLPSLTEPPRRSAGRPVATEDGDDDLMNRLSD
ncbi:unnamed protein product [Soboliphyme baturini]|uniref:Uncharacterized protein n=1 Tax=Soboliphyme baturini TaxID=241478 RepID=A0A183JB72_9BILA|nr:unnamed protein product [Soboliphyme baturini]